MTEQKRLLIGLASGLWALLLCVGCSDAWKKDVSKDGVSIGTVVRPAAGPPAKEAMKVLVTQLQYKEGQTSEAAIPIHIYQPELLGDLTTEMNLDGPLASIQKTLVKIDDVGSYELRLKWTPGEDVVPEGQATVDYKTILTVRAGSKDGTAAQSVDKDVTISITKNILTPEIVGVEFSAKGDLVEGTSNYFTVTVRDPETKDVLTRRRPPTLFSVPTTKFSSAITFPNINSGVTRDEKDPTLWRYFCVIDIPDEWTKSISYENFTLQARSNHNETTRSPQFVVNFKVQSTVANPVVTWTEPTIFVAKQVNNVYFTIQDPKQEGDVFARFKTKCSNLGAICRCEKGNMMQTCSIQWSPGIDISSKDFVLEAYTENTGIKVDDTPDPRANYFGKIEAATGAVSKKSPILTFTQTIKITLDNKK